MPVIRITLHAGKVRIRPDGALGPLNRPFCAAVLSAGGTLSAQSNGPCAPLDRCGDICTKLRGCGFTLKGAEDALDLALQQGFRPSEPVPPPGSMQDILLGSGPRLRAAGNDLERWAHAGLNVLVGSANKGLAGPSRVDRNFLSSCYVKLCEKQGLSEREWEQLVLRIRKYHKQIGKPPEVI